MKYGIGLIMWLSLAAPRSGVLASPAEKISSPSAKAEASGDGHDESHAQEQDVSTKIGPEKGITEADEKFGFRLSAEASRNFELSYLKLEGRGPWRIPRSAIVRSGEETNLYRRREGFFRRIDFRVLKHDGQHVLVVSDQLRADDEVVSSGIGFLRVAELAAFGGVAAEHTH